MDTLYRIFFWSGLICIVIATLGENTTGVVAGTALFLSGAINEASIKIAKAIQAKQ